MLEKSNHKKLIINIIENSINKEWDKAKNEWYCYNLKEDEDGICVCGHHLKNLYYIKNKHNDISLIVGSSCVKKFKNNQMDEYMNELLSTKKLLLKEEKAYQRLKVKQINRGVIISVRKSYLIKMYNLNVINPFEYNFYTDIYDKLSLTLNQQKLKTKINDKIVDYYNTTKSK